MTTLTRADWEQRAQQLKIEGRAFINGEYTDAASGETFECLSPVDGRFLAKVATEKMGIPPFLAKVAMLTEFFAPICLVLGIFTRIAALSVIILMAVAMTKHVKNGYFSNWSGKKAGEGVEFHLLYAGSAFALFLTGPGPWSVDAWCMNIVHVIFG